jgi:hypothetical protein
MGGVLIYGVATDPVDKTRPVCLEPILPSNVDLIIVAATSKIRHPISGLRWKTVPKGKRPSALLIDVPVSSLAPHQVIGNYRYYRRQGAESVPMSHDLVELYFGRRLGPVLVPHLADPSIMPGSTSPHRAGTFTTVVSLHNEGVRAARQVLLRVVFENNGLAWHEPLGGENITQTDQGTAVNVLDRDNLLYPGLPTSYLRLRFAVKPAGVGEGTYPFAIEVYADEVLGRCYGISLLQTAHGQYRLSATDLGPPKGKPSGP